MKAKCCVCGAEDTCRALIGRVDYNPDPGAPVEVVAYFKDDRAFENWVCPECSGGSVDTFDFGEALSAIKRGGRAARIGWNGKGMWIALSPGCERLDADKVWSPAARSFVASRGGQVTFRPNIIMKTADDEIVPWVASQSDLLANDWVAM